MERYIIVNSLPYFLFNGCAYKVKWENGERTIGEKTELSEIPEETFSEISVIAKCEVLNSIDEVVADNSEKPSSDTEDVEGNSENTEEKTNEDADSEGEKPEDEKPEGEKPEDEKPEGEKPEDEVKQEEKPKKKGKK